MTQQLHILSIFKAKTIYYWILDDQSYIVLAKIHASVKIHAVGYSLISPAALDVAGVSVLQLP